MEKFILKEEHVKLLQHAEWRWEDCEFGAPAIDCKRPFGNSDVITDVMEILEVKNATCPHCGEVIDESILDKYDALYRELETAVSVVFDVLSFTPGEYQLVETTDSRGCFDRRWQRIAV